MWSYKWNYLCAINLLGHAQPETQNQRLSIISPFDCLGTLWYRINFNRGQIFRRTFDNAEKANHKLREVPVTLDWKYLICNYILITTAVHIWFEKKWLPWVYGCIWWSSVISGSTSASGRRQLSVWSSALTAPTKSSLWHIIFKWFQFTNIFLVLSKQVFCTPHKEMHFSAKQTIDRALFNCRLSFPESLTLSKTFLDCLQRQAY